MESYTVVQVGRSTSRVMFAAERGPIEIVRAGKRIGVVLSPEAWAKMSKLTPRMILAKVMARCAVAYKAYKSDHKGSYYEGQADVLDELEVWIEAAMHTEPLDSSTRTDEATAGSFEETP